VQAEKEGIASKDCKERGHYTQEAKAMGAHREGAGQARAKGVQKKIKQKRGDGGKNGAGEGVECKKRARTVHSKGEGMCEGARAVHARDESSAFKGRGYVQ
jgi:hypothetical protein